ncbi:MAG: hypothetical protein KGS46_21120, partial [Chloroflexi bacterium]|nr:hypothetical protein [Chloroflexota bacterium]
RALCASKLADEVCDRLRLLVLLDQELKHSSNADLLPRQNLSVATANKVPRISHQLISSISRLRLNDGNSTIKLNIHKKPDVLRVFSQILAYFLVILDEI